MNRTIPVVGLLLLIAVAAVIVLLPSATSVREKRARRFMDRCMTHEFTAKQCEFTYALKRDMEDDDDAAIGILLNQGSLKP